MESMDSFERLELSFLRLPSTKIFTSLITPDGTTIIQNSFEEFDCPTEWIMALRAIAAATKNAHFSDRGATASVNMDSPSASPTAVTLNSSGYSTHRHIRSSSSSSSCSQSCSSTTKISDRRAPTPSTATLNEEPNDLQIGWPSLEDFSSNWRHFRNATDGLVDNLPRSSPETCFGVDTSSAPAHVRDAGRQSPMDTMLPTSSMELHLRSSNLAGDQEVYLPPSDKSSTTSSVSAMAKRKEKLEERLEAMRDVYLPDKDEFNDTVRRLYQHSRASPESIVSMEHFGYILGRLGNVSSAVGIIYSLLSWQIFRWEEERLVQVEGQAVLIAAKQVNDKMAEMSSRRAKTKDWASDGRRAAGMVFESISNLSTAAQSFALLVLAENITLDGLLRIAHFPVLRERFRIKFSQIVESRQKEWENLAANPYLVFDYKEFLRKGMALSELSSSESLSDRDATTYSIHSLSPSFDTSTCIFINEYSARDSHQNYETRPSSMETSLQNVNDRVMTDIIEHATLRYGGQPFIDIKI